MLDFFAAGFAGLDGAREIEQPAPRAAEALGMTNPTEVPTAECYRRETMRLSFLLSACLFAGCFSDPADVPFTYSVGGTVSGMWEGAGVTLRLEAPDIDEVLEVDADGSFTFETLVPEQTAFTMTVDEQPDAHTCTVTGADMVGDANIDDLEIDCTGPSVEVALSAPIPFTFDVDTLAYDLDVSTLIDQTAVTVTAPAATALRLDDADLVDATPSSAVALAFGANTLTLEVEAGTAHRTFTMAFDRGAAEIDQYVYGKASNTGIGDAYSTATALSVDTLVVGAPFEDSNAIVINGVEANEASQDSGAVYVYRRSGSTWVKEAYLKAILGPGDQFGAAVALDGDTLVVGAPGDDGPGDTASNRGAAFVFHRTGTAWTQESMLRPSDAADTEGFGTSVATSGDVVAVGSIGGISSQGAVYLYRRSGASWVEEDRVQGSEGGSGDNFGTVALQGNRLVVGALANLFGTGDRAYVFESDSGNWMERTILRPLPGTGALQHFGSAVALDGDTVVVGARRDSCSCRGIDPVVDNTTASGSGAVYVFNRVAGVWSHENFIKASNSDPNDEFGTSLSLHGDLLIVGAPSEAGGGSGSTALPTDNTSASAGAAYVYRRDGSGWIEERYLKSENTDAGDSFGRSVVVAAEVGAIVGAAGESSGATGLDGDAADNTLTGSGAVYVFR